MKAFKNLILLFLFPVFSTVGCIAGLQTQPSPTDAITATSGTVLFLSAPKTTYTSTDIIPLELNIQNGQFDLLVPFIDVASGAFTQLRVQDTSGNTIEPKRLMHAPISEEIFVKKSGKPVQCIHGLELKAESTYTVPLKNLQKYYGLQKGSYTVTLTMELSIYRDFLEKRHPEIRELEEEIKRIQKVADAHVSAADKRSAVKDLQQQIESLERKYKDIYLPVKSLLGKALLTSNSITLTIM